MKNSAAFKAFIKRYTTFSKLSGRLGNERCQVYEGTVSSLTGLKIPAGFREEPKLREGAGYMRSVWVNFADLAILQHREGTIAVSHYNSREDFHNAFDRLLRV